MKRPSINLSVIDPLNLSGRTKEEEVGGDEEGRRYVEA